MTHDRDSVSVDEFLTMWRQCARGSHSSLLDDLDRELRRKISGEPDRAVVILQTLASGNKYDRETAAIFVKLLFVTRSDRAIDILLTLLKDRDADIGRQALETLDEVTSERWITADDAQRLAAVTRSRSNQWSG